MSVLIVLSCCLCAFMEELESAFYTRHNPRLVFILPGHAPPDHRWSWDASALPSPTLHRASHLGRPYLEDRPDYRRGDVGGTDGCILAAHRSQRNLCLPALFGRAAGCSGRSKEQGEGIAALSGSHRTPLLAGSQVVLDTEIYRGRDGALGVALLKMSCALPARMNAQLGSSAGCDRLRGMPPDKCG